MYKGAKFSIILVWFFAIAGVIGNAIWHPLFAVRVGGYYPGLYTSFAYWIVGPILLKRLWEVREYQ
jgi:pilus assembly protein TadC